MLHGCTVETDVYPSLADYALIGDCHSAALVSRSGSIDWCCLPRFDSDSCFGRLLDWHRGGYFQIAPDVPCAVRRHYLPGGLILVTTFTAGANEASVTDFFAMRRGGRRHPRRELIRIIEGIRGRMRFRIEVSPRLDCGEVKPWIQRAGTVAHAVVGSNTGLMIFGDVPLQLDGEHDLCAELEVNAGARRHIAIRFVPPEDVHAVPTQARAAADIAAHMDETLEWWHEWVSKIIFPDRPGACIVRSAITLKALTYAPTGAIIAAPTTSLPEHIGGERNWDYRYSWIRDSVFTVRALADLGCRAESDGFRRFIERSAAGNADELQVLYAVDGRRRLTELTLDHLDGWRGSRPVRVGNAAEAQFQADMYGLLLELAWHWSRRGNSPGWHYWDFLVDTVETAIARWHLPDRGIWEIRSAPRHFVHSKVMCWAAVNRGIALAEAHSLPAPTERWRGVREEMRRVIEAEGIDHDRGCFVQSFGSRDVDAALLLLPTVDFVVYEDPRMMRTADVILDELCRDGLVLRYRTEDGLRGSEGTFLACTFWLAECLARQGRHRDARAIFQRAVACANDVGLFSEEYLAASGEMLGNFPQGLTHLAHISAALVLEGVPESG